ncbi:MAG TPA: hypothetical protein VGK32_20370 [Vicinamibacterales bacterium]|jgi:hypothetical protein
MPQKTESDVTLEASLTKDETVLGVARQANRLKMTSIAVTDNIDVLGRP